jgi:hypothetical protein
VLYLIFSINLVSQVTLRSSGTDILYRCHLLRRLHNILHFLWLYNELFIILYNILKNAELDCSQIIILNILCTIYARLYTCLTSIYRFALRDKITLQLLKPNNVRIRCLRCQIIVLPSTGSELTLFIHCSTIYLALRPAPYTTRPHPLPKNGASIIVVLSCLVRQIYR